jgi:threonine dehydratase
VLMGLQVPAGERGELNRRLRALGYRYWDETTNPACRIFVGVNGD